MRNFTTIKQSSRSAFTLVELLLVIAIIAILASLGVGLIGQAQEDAAINSTRSRITLIEKILEIELEDYEVRRSPISVSRLSTIVSNSALTTSNSNLLLHVKNLRRMIIADFIRTEMPDGSEQTLGVFPSDTFRAYLESSDVGIDPLTITPGPSSISQFNSITVKQDIAFRDGFDDRAADKSELLYRILQNISVDGVPAIETLGNQAIGDSDNDGDKEVIDAFGEPLFLQWLQEELGPPDPSATPPTPDYNTGDLKANVWVSNGLLVGLSKEHSGLTSFDPLEYSKPVLPTQIRPFLTSNRLIEIDGAPANYNPSHAF